MTKQIILVNGPARSGKDTVGEIITKLLGNRAALAKFAKVLKCGTHGLYAALHGDFETVNENLDFGGDGDENAKSYKAWGAVAMSCDDAHFEDRKGEPLPQFYGLSPREAYIAVSEVFMKVVYGQAIFGEILAANLEKMSEEIIVVTDSGFTPEAEVLVEKYGAENVFVISLARPNTAFDQNANPAQWRSALAHEIAYGRPVKEMLSKITDSRSYIDLPQCRKFHLRNDGDKADLEQSVLTALENFGL